MNYLTFKRCLFAGLLAAFLAGKVSIVGAAPVKFRFEGEITSIESTGIPAFSLSAEIAVGQTAFLEVAFDSISFPKAANTSGSFTTPGGKTTIAPSVLELSMGSMLLRDVLARIFVSHDQLSPSTGGSASIVEAESIDIRGIGSPLPTSDLQWSTGGGFANLGSVLDGGEALSDPLVWNSLPLRSLITTFSGSGNGLIQVHSLFGNGSVVPEPSTSVLVAFLAVISSSVIRVG